MMKLTLIAACDDAWGIGRNNTLAWHEPSDLAHFRERTMGKHLLMGRKTFDGLPRALKGRTIHVLSRNAEGTGLHFGSILEIGVDLGLNEMLVAGGGEIYRQLEPQCQFAEITRIPGDHQCDTFMPNLRLLGWKKFAEKLLTESITVEYWRKS
jgi:dihydrofolate reductase